MALDSQLLDILACPEDKGALLYFESEDCLYNPRLKRKYAIKDDIPIMLIDEAEAVDDAEHDDVLDLVVRRKADERIGGLGGLLHLLGKRLGDGPHPGGVEDALRRPSHPATTPPPALRRRASLTLLMRRMWA